ncbi:hypothetical protein [Brevundimonas sp.]|uniref:hypothetical protein n=1 Tax=Brevundimonas sp. TaxID=1871086 RepID=UPI00391A5974
MGGYSSGRYRIRNRGAVEQSLRFDIRRLRRSEFIRPGARVSGTWSWSRAGVRTGAIGFTIDLTDPANGFVELDYTTNGERRLRVVSLDAAPCRYGGRRFYFRCPRTGRRCELLCCVGGEFASRQHHRLTYSSQSETPLDRLQRAKDKAEARALGTDGRPRPRGENRERLVERWSDLEEDYLATFAAEASRRFGIQF